MNPIGLPPALRRAVFTRDSTPPAIGADTDVPAAANMPPPKNIIMLAPAADMSGYPLPSANPGYGSLPVPLTVAKYFATLSFCQSGRA